MASSQTGQSSEGSSREDELSLTSQDQEGSESLPHVVLYDRIDALVDFLLHKYRRKELTSKAEMLHTFMKDYPEHFPPIFNKVSECLYMVFGIDVKEVDPPGQIYVLVPVLGLTAKTGLLIMIITAIFRKGNHASENVIWLALNRMQVFDGSEHFIYVDLRKFITEDLVQEGYLEYRQVPNSDPALYEFLRGPRTRAETSKMKVLDHLVKINSRDPWSYPFL
ncbi:PREDICTED: melanoma-associated antigen 8-like [Chinchilla lanigera]|uniref:melanoma-associated antigen 8-like n=1 Tax=Chinchilla lanigera TaxID=34839 RepID=UPI000698E6C7|nr:PREDICTED: melanoma-associated antigen 8-like [Chinchilla lanigera]